MSCHVEVVERSGRWLVREVNGERTALLGVHRAKYAAVEHAQRWGATNDRPVVVSGDEVSS